MGLWGEGMDVGKGWGKGFARDEDEDEDGEWWVVLVGVDCFCVFLEGGWI